MTWTTNPPTEPGYYFVRDTSRDNEIHIVMLDRDGDVVSMGDDGYQSMIIFCRGESYEWSPIELPS